MRQVTREVRGAFIKMLTGLTYKGVVVPVKGGVFNGKGGIISPTAGVEFQAYINIINQFRGSNSLKNGTDSLTTLTLDINTVFSGSSYSMAGAEWVEEITDLVNDALYDNEKFRLKEFGINNDRFVVTTNNYYGQPMPLQYTDTSRVFRSVLIFELGIQQLKVATPDPNLWIKTLA